MFSKHEEKSKELHQISLKNTGIQKQKKALRAEWVVEARISNDNLLSLLEQKRSKINAANEVLKFIEESNSSKKNRSFSENQDAIEKCTNFHTELLGDAFNLTSRVLSLNANSNQLQAVVKKTLSDIEELYLGFKQETAGYIGNNSPNMLHAYQKETDMKKDDKDGWRNWETWKGKVIGSEEGIKKALTRFAEKPKSARELEKVIFEMGRENIQKTLDESKKSLW